jgi:hypothetical protein
LWRFQPSGMLRHVVWWKFTDVSEVLAASVITHCPDDVGSKHLWKTKFYQTTRCDIPEGSHLHNISRPPSETIKYSLT